MTEITADKLKSVINPWLLGADPEFAVFTPPARVYNQGTYSVNCDVRENCPDDETGLGTALGAIGHDHGGRVWELRPAPAQSSYALLLNIWKLLRAKQMAPVERFRWKAGGVAEGDTIGGHVHFGFRKWEPGQLEALSSVTTNLERLDILPTTESQTRRDTNPDYGNLVGTRNSGGHVEYRAPASWLDKPGQAFAALTTYKLAALEPGSTSWRRNALKQDYLGWVAAMSQRDVDAYLLWRLLDKYGLEKVQADPASDFRPRWREKVTQQDLWL